MVKKIILIALLVLVLIVAGFFTCRYAAYVRDENPDKTFLLPRVEVAVVEITSLTAEKIDMNMKMLIENHLPMTFTADSLEYILFIDETEVMKSRYQKRIEIANADSSWISLPVTLYMEKLKSVIERNEQKKIDSVEYHLQVSFFSDYLLKKNFDLNIRRFLPLIYIPEVNVDHLEVDSLNFSRAAVILHTSVTNKNVFPLQASNVKYKFAIENHELIEGDIPGFVNIRAKGVTELNIPMVLTFKEMTKTLFDMLTKGSKLTYDLHMDFTVESKNAMVENSKFILHSDGSLKSLRKAAKELKSDK